MSLKTTLTIRSLVHNMKITEGLPHSHMIPHVTHHHIQQLKHIEVSMNGIFLSRKGPYEVGVLIRENMVFDK